MIQEDPHNNLMVEEGHQQNTISKNIAVDVISVFAFRMYCFCHSSIKVGVSLLQHVQTDKPCNAALDEMLLQISKIISQSMSFSLHFYHIFKFFSLSFTSCCLLMSSGSSLISLKDNTRHQIPSLTGRSHIKYHCEMKCVSYLYLDMIVIHMLYLVIFQYLLYVVCFYTNEEYQYC